MGRAKKNFRGLSIFYKLLFCFAGISMVATLVSGFVHYVRTTKIIQSSIEKQLESNLKAAISYFDKTYASYIKRDLMTLESSPSIENLLTVQRDQIYFHKPEVERQFLNLSKTNSKYLSMSFFDASGNELVNVAGRKRVRKYRSINQLPQDNVSSRRTIDLFQRLKSVHPRAILFEGPFRYINNRFTFLIGISKLEPDIGGFGGAIIFHIDLLDYIGYLSNLKIFGRSIIWMIDNNNNVIFSPPDEESSFDPRPYLADEDPAKYTSYIISDEAILGSDNDSLLSVALSIPPDMISSEMNEALFITLMVALAVLFTSMTMAFFLSRQFSRPISNLVKTSLSISKGDFNVRASKETGGELGLLAKTINSMTENLQNTTVSKDYMDSIFRSMNDSLIVLDRDGAIMTVNKATLELLGYREEDIILQPLRKVIPEGTLPELEPEFLVKKKVVTNTETEYITNDGYKIPVSFSSAIMLDADNRVQGIVCVAQDITERKKSEKALHKAKEDAEIANMAKSQFLANMSHELRTPMNGVLGFSDLLKDTQLDEIQSDYVETIASSGHILLSLISDVLDLSKIEAGEINLEAIDFDLEQVTENAMRIIRSKINEPDVQLVYEMAENMPERFIGDPTRIQQLMMNLLSNAAKFTHKGEIKLSLGSGPADGRNIQNVRISVKDTGVGIPEEKQKTIFDAFVQADSSTTREYGGTGLGLAIVSRLVEAMDGEIKLVSEKGAGSEFIVILPLRADISEEDSDVQIVCKGEGEIEKNSLRNADDEILRGVKVLLAEDNAGNSRLVHIQLDKMKCDIDFAVNGQEAIEKAKAGEYNIILMDIQMPVMNGIEATEIIRRDIDNDIPIVAITADVMERDREKSISSGMNDYLMKPVSFDELKKTILKWAVPLKP